MKVFLNQEDFGICHANRSINQDILENMAPRRPSTLLAPQSDTGFRAGWAMAMTRAVVLMPGKTLTRPDRFSQETIKRICTS